MEIVEADKSDLDSFFAYLENQLSENGNGQVPLFQPMSREQSEVPEATKDKFIQGFSHQVGDLGWRKLWVVKDTSGRIKGHIDLRHHSDELRDAKLYEIGAGTSEIRRMLIGRELFEESR